MVEHWCEVPGVRGSTPLLSTMKKKWEFGKVCPYCGHHEHYVCNSFIGMVGKFTKEMFSSCKCGKLERFVQWHGR